MLWDRGSFASCPWSARSSTQTAAVLGRPDSWVGGADLLLEAGAGWVGVRGSEHPFCWAQQVKKTSRAPCHGPQQKHRITPRLFPNAFWAPSGELGHWRQEGPWQASAIKLSGVGYPPSSLPVSKKDNSAHDRQECSWSHGGAQCPSVEYEQRHEVLASGKALQGCDKAPPCSHLGTDGTHTPGHREQTAGYSGQWLLLHQSQV